MTRYIPFREFLKFAKLLKKQGVARELRRAYLLRLSEQV